LLEHGPTRDSSPFADVPRWAGATWFEPVLQAEVTYAEVMQGRLRDPVLRALV
jgi:ATP dependent DNA ligase-like protein